MHRYGLLRHLAIGHLSRTHRPISPGIVLTGATHPALCTSGRCKLYPVVVHELAYHAPGSEKMTNALWGSHAPGAGSPPRAQVFVSVPLARSCGPAQGRHVRPPSERHLPSPPDSPSRSPAHAPVPPRPGRSSPTDARPPLELTRVRLSVFCHVHPSHPVALYTLTLVHVSTFSGEHHLSHVSRTQRQRVRWHPGSPCWVHRYSVGVRPAWGVLLSVCSASLRACRCPTQLSAVSSRPP